VSATPGEAVGQTVVVVPVKAFSQAKMRLAPVLSPPQRAALAKELAHRVVVAAYPMPVAVVCDDPEVASWAHGLGARPLREPGIGLNGAVAAAFAQLSSEGYERVVVAHGDLPLATNLTWLAQGQGIVLVPDRHLDGTNVIGLPAGCGFRFSYGPGSFGRHKEEAARLGLPWRAVHDDALAWDVDQPADMSALSF
jgi:2-phospho-L-lactate/phosphoenolpyruvate guanylyltransferase